MWGLLLRERGFADTWRRFGDPDGPTSLEAELEAELERHPEPACGVCAGVGCGGCRWTGHARERDAG